MNKKLLTVEYAQAFETTNGYFFEYKIGAVRHHLPVSHSKYVEMKLLEEEIYYGDSEAETLIDLVNKQNHVISAVSIDVVNFRPIGRLVIQDELGQCACSECHIQDIFLLARIAWKEDMNNYMYTSHRFIEYLMNDIAKAVN